MPARQSPTVRRRRLGAELRRLREEAGLTIERVAATLECSESKVSRIETGQVGAMPRDVRDMLELYKVGPEQREALIQIARSQARGWPSPGPAQPPALDQDGAGHGEATAASSWLAIPNNGNSWLIPPAGSVAPTHRK
jgi:transcriptional regulator with XRE-family HTH domain